MWRPFTGPFVEALPPAVAAVASFVEERASAMQLDCSPCIVVLRLPAATAGGKAAGAGTTGGAGTGAGAGAGAGAGVGAATHPSWREESWLGVRSAAAALGLPLGAMVKSVALVANGALVVRGCGGGGASRGRLVATLC